jgi:hypothetical protein
LLKINFHELGKLWEERADSEESEEEDVEEEKVGENEVAEEAEEGESKPAQEGRGENDQPRAEGCHDSKGSGSVNDAMCLAREHLKIVMEGLDLRKDLSPSEAAVVKDANQTFCASVVLALVRMHQFLWTALSTFMSLLTNEEILRCEAVTMLGQVTIELQTAIETYSDHIMTSKGGFWASLAMETCLYLVRREEETQDGGAPGEKRVVEFFVGEHGLFGALESKFGVTNPLGITVGKNIANMLASEDRDTRGLFSPLSCASFFGSLPMIKALLKLGADPNNEWDDCVIKNPLVICFLGGHLECFNALLDGGATFVSPPELVKQLVTEAKEAEGDCDGSEELMTVSGKRIKDCRLISLRRIIDRTRHYPVKFWKHCVAKDDFLPPSPEAVSRRRQMIFSALKKCGPALANQENLKGATDDEDEEDCGFVGITLLHGLITDYPEDLELITAVLDAGAEFRYDDAKAEDPRISRIPTLILVCREANLRLTKLFLERGLLERSKEHLSDDGILAASWALAETTRDAVLDNDKAKLDCVELLWSAGLDRVLFPEYNAILRACLSTVTRTLNQKEVLKVLKYCHSKGVNVKDYHNDEEHGCVNLLSLACIRGMPEVAAFAVKELNCNPDVAAKTPDVFGNEMLEPLSPLGYALRYKHFKLATELLLTYKASPVIPSLPASQQPIMQLFDEEIDITDEQALPLVQLFLRLDPGLLDHLCFIPSPDMEYYEDLRKVDPFIAAFGSSFKIKCCKAFLDSGSRAAFRSLHRFVGSEGLPPFSTPALLLAQIQRWNDLAVLLPYGALVTQKVKLRSANGTITQGTSILEEAERAAARPRGGGIPRHILTSIRLAAQKEQAAAASGAGASTETLVEAGAAAAAAAASATAASSSASSASASATALLKLFEDPSYSAIATTDGGAGGGKAKSKKKKTKKKGKKKAVAKAGAGGSSCKEKDVAEGDGDSDDSGTTDDERVEGDDPDDFGRNAPDVSFLFARLKIEREAKAKEQTDKKGKR